MGHVAEKRTSWILVLWWQSGALSLLLEAVGFADQSNRGRA